MTSAHMPLTKVSATGNDFIIVDLLRNSWQGGGSSRPAWVRSWCDRHEGIGADGGVFLEPHAELDFAWDFYNSDGSPAEMCGNAARAVSLYMHKLTGRRELAFATRAGAVRAMVRGPGEIEVELAPITDAQWNQWTGNGVDQLAFDFVRAGVPHAVVRVPDIGDRESLRALALEIKREPRFSAAGTNVTFVRPVGPGAAESVTFERGVEDFTLSCGTGAVAAAHSLLRGEEGKNVEVQVPGGKLNVVWKNGRPALTGPAVIIAEIVWKREEKPL